MQAAEPITDTERAGFKKVYDEFDLNKDGHITASELKNVLKKLGQNPSDEEVQEFIKACDTDKNGTIEFNEFCRYLVGLRRKVRAWYLARDESDVLGILPMLKLQVYNPHASCQFSRFSMKLMLMVTALSLLTKC